VRVAYPRNSHKNPEFDPNYHSTNHTYYSGNQNYNPGNQHHDSRNQNHNTRNQAGRWDDRGQYSRQSSNTSQRPNVAYTNHLSNDRFPSGELGNAPTNVISPGHPSYPYPTPIQPWISPETHFRRLSLLSEGAKLPHPLHDPKPTLESSPVQLTRFWHQGGHEEREREERERLEELQSIHGSGFKSGHGSAVNTIENVRPGSAVR